MNPPLPTDAEISAGSTKVRALLDTMNEVLYGQQELIEAVVTGLLARGHLLLEGLPGLGKTELVKGLSGAIGLQTKRVQFTPDLLPGDITGNPVLQEVDGRRTFVFQPGPLFASLVLADEINRASPKTQSALLEAMQEGHVTVLGETHPLPQPFFVLATQNPIELEGTYPLPEAQLDRFLMHVRVDYPDGETERAILHLNRDEALREGPEAAGVRLSQASIFAARRAIFGLYMAPEVEDYLVHLVMATRRPLEYAADLGGWLRFGASPRATLALDRCSRARAWLGGRDYVSPEDLQSVAPDVLRHRVLLSYEAEAEGKHPDDFIAALLARVPAP